VSISVSGMHDLETRILELEKLQAQQMIELKASGANIVNSLSPSNILKSALKDVAQTPDLRNTVINTAIGIGAGLLGKKLYVRGSKNIFKKISGSAMQFVIANFVRKKLPQMQNNNLQHNHEN